jgi:hypothetical protein
MKVLRHTVAVQCEMFSIEPIVTDGQVVEEPLHGLHALRTLIISIFILGNTQNPFVYAAPVDSEEAHRSVGACQTIRNCPGIFARIRRSVMRRIEACIEFHGGHFEHLVYIYYFCHNSQIKCFLTEVDTDIFFVFY